MEKNRNESRIEAVPEKKKVIVYLHGFGSSGQSGTVAHLRKIFPMYDVFALDIPVNPEQKQI